MIWAVLALLLAIAAAPFVIEAFRPGMDSTARTKAPGSFADLPGGVTHYRWLGPKGGPVVVCVHGLTTPSFVWAPIAEGLVKKGFRVLLYDLYGRGYSDRPNGPQDADFFVSQLDALLENQGVEAPFTLLGYSMGGAIAPAFATRFPRKVQKLVLLAPAGMGHDLGPVARLVTNHNWLGAWLMMAWYGKSYRQALEAERDLPTEVEGIVDLQQAELTYRGFRAAVLSSMRGILDRDLDAEHRILRNEGVPVLAIWGSDDEIIPIAGMQKLEEWNPDARQDIIADAGHALAYTHSSQVLKAIEALS